MWVTGKVALVTLIRSSNDLAPSDELAEQIRAKIETSSLARSWVVDKVAVLDENPPAAKLASNQKMRKLAVA